MTVPRASLAAIVVATMLGCASERAERVDWPVAAWAEIPFVEKPTRAAVLVGHDFAPEAQLLFRLVACGDDRPVPAGFDVSTIELHCLDLRQFYARYRRDWLMKARRFLAQIEPRDLPSRVVYPFGGGDLLTALAVYPDATEFTTLSRVASGDPRRLDDLRPKHLDGTLSLLRDDLRLLTTGAFNTRESLRLEAESTLPGELAFTFVALAVHGYEPLSLRYFTLRPDGSLSYLTDDDLRGLETRRLEVDPFAHMELRFRTAGNPLAPIRSLRHFAQDLDDAHLGKNVALLRHLEARGPVAAMTKAAHQELGAEQFSMLRGYLLHHMTWMVSDSSGIPPRFAKAAGFAQDAYGAFDPPEPCSLFEPRDTRDLRELFRSSRALLRFTFGFSDRAGNRHLLVTRPTDTSPPPANPEWERGDDRLRPSEPAPPVDLI